MNCVNSCQHDWRFSHGSIPRSTDHSSPSAEFELLRALKHPAVVRYHEHWESDNAWYIVTEFAAHGDLQRYLKGGEVVKQNGDREPTLRKLPLKEALYYYAQIALALLYCHKNRVLHRDLKPANVLVMKDGSLRLADFGTGKQLDGTEGLSHTHAGTPYYEAPEFWVGLPHTHKADIWSMGILLYELVCGTKPFDTSTGQAPNLWRKIETYTMAPFASHVDEQTKALILWCLRRNPMSRPDIVKICNSAAVRPYIEAYRATLPQGEHLPCMDMLTSNPAGMHVPAQDETDSQGLAPEAEAELARKRGTPKPNIVGMIVVHGGKARVDMH